MTAATGSLLVAIFAIFAVQVMVLIVAPLKAVAIGIPASTATALVAAWGVLGILAELPGSALSDALGRRRVIAVGGVAMGFAAATLAIANDLPGILAGMILFGLGQALSFGPALAFLTEVAPDDAQTGVQSINGAVQGISSVIAALLAGLLIPFGYQVALGAVLAFSVIVCLAVLRVSQALESTARVQLRSGIFDSYARAIRMVVRRPPVTFAALVSVIYALGFLVITASVLPVVLIGFQGMDPGGVGIIIAARNLVAATLSLTFAAAVSRFGLIKATVGTSWIAVLGTGAFAIVAVAPSLVWVALLIQAAGMAYGAAASNLLVRQATNEQERAVGISATTLASRVTVLAVSLLIGPLITQSSVSLAFVTAAALGIPIVLLMSAVGRNVRYLPYDQAQEGSPP